MYKEYLALNNLQWLICHKTQSTIYLMLLVTLNLNCGSLHAVVFNVLDCDIILSEFELQPCYYVYIQANIRGESI